VLLLMPLCSGVSGETVWKIAQGLSSALLRRQEAADRGFSLAPLERLRDPISGLISIFQTVSEKLFEKASGVG
jgi:hypothetical protein